jgi:phosphoglycolate phosphatase
MRTLWKNIVVTVKHSNFSDQVNKEGAVMNVLKELNIGGTIVKVKAVGFDKDGTLFDSVKFWSYIDQIRISSFLEIAGTDAVEDWEQTMGFVQPNTVDHNGVQAVASLKEEIILVAGLLYKRKKWPWFECKEKSADIFQHADKVMQLEKAFQRYEGVPDVFYLLNQHQIQVGILTSDSFSRTERLMMMLGVKDLMKFIITPELVTHGKPHPEMVHNACSMLEISTSEFMVVGDSVVDMLMAKEAGSIAVGLVTYEGSEAVLSQYADILIHSITDIRISE